MEIMLTKVLLRLSFQTTKTQKHLVSLSRLLVWGKPVALSTAEVNRRKALATQSNERTFYGKVAVDFFTCDRHLMSGVTLWIALRRSIDDFVFMSNATMHSKVKIVEANLYMLKMTLNDDVVSAIERTLLTSPASCLYLETLTKTFLSSTGLHSLKQEDIFARNQSEDWLCVWTQTKLFSVTNYRIHFTSGNLISRRFLSIKMESQSQIVQYQQMIISAFTSIQYQI